MTVETRMCHRCLTRLGPEHDVGVEAPSEGTEYLSKTARLILAARRRRRQLLRWTAAFLIVFVALMSWWVYLQFIWEPSPVPLPTSARELPAAGVVWPLEHGDPGATRSTPAAATLDGEIVWRLELDTPITTSLTTDGERIFVGLADARLLALSVEDGSEVWSRKVPGQLDVAPTVADGVIYVAQRDGLVLALDPASGEQIWAFNSGGPHFTAPVPFRGTLYTAGQRVLRGLDADSGVPLWERDGLANQDFTIQPVIEDEKVIPAVSNRLYFHDRLTMHRENAFRTSRMRHIAVEDDAIVGVSQREIVVIDQSATPYAWDGIPLMRAVWSQLFFWGVAPAPPRDSNLWQERVRDRDSQPLAPAIDEGRLFVAFASGEVRARGLRDGVELWTREAGEPITGDPLLTADGLLLPVGTSLLLLDPATGEELARRSLGDEKVSQVIVTEGGTYAAAGVIGTITGRATLLALR
jgi:outer membrane protein assembly factor BamB